MNFSCFRKAFWFNFFSGFCDVFPHAWSITNFNPIETIFRICYIILNRTWGATTFNLNSAFELTLFPSVSKSFKSQLWF